MVINPEQQSVKIALLNNASPLVVALESFAKAGKIDGQKGKIAALLAINRQILVKQENEKITWPLDPADWKTEKQGQVKGLGLSATQRVLKDYQITKVLAQEGGRTSRGIMQVMVDYVDLLNRHYANSGSVDLSECEKFWLIKAQAFFDKKPFVLAVDPKWSIRRAISHLVQQAATRQSDGSGTMYVGTLMQHMVGAKLDILLGEGVIKHHNSNQNDASSRGGDFDLEDTAIHVTTSPAGALVGKCIRNLKEGIKPIVITTARGAVALEVALEVEQGAYLDRIDIFEFEQFLAANVIEIGRFNAAGRKATLAKILEAYNRIIDAVETDQSLKIQTNDM